MEQKVFELLKDVKCFEDLVNILNNISAKAGGAVIRGIILNYMEVKYPVEFENWLA